MSNPHRRETRIALFSRAYDAQHVHPNLPVFLGPQPCQQGKVKERADHAHSRAETGDPLFSAIPAKLPFIRWYITSVWARNTSAQCRAYPSS